MEVYQERVMDERYFLMDKIERLEAFIQGDIFNGLPDIDKTLLSQQLVAMKAYGEILRQRIERFSTIGS
jgi:hypothetical protein